MTQPTRRSAHTLIELMVAMTAGGLLLVGLSSSILIALQATDLENTPTITILEGSAALDNMLSEMEFALSFSEITTNAVTFTVPDQDGDSNPETIRYAWSGTPGDALTYQRNGGAVMTLLENVHVLQYDLLQPPANLLSNADMEAGTVDWEAFTESTIDSDNKDVYAGAWSLYHSRWVQSGESGVRQDVTAHITSGTTYEIGEWLMTWGWDGPYTARVQLRIDSTGEGEQIFASSGVSINDTAWSPVGGTVTPTWSGSLLSAYWEAVSDIQDTYRDNAYMRVKQGDEQCVNVSLQVGSDPRSLVQSGVAFLNSPL
jgi:Tfp pilus assembly protein PilW